MFEKVNSKIMAAVSTLFIWMAMGTVIFHSLEKWSWVQSFYFSVATITTVGYGDLYPTTDLSRLVVSLYIISGVSIAIVSLSLIGSSFLAQRENDLLNRSQLRFFKKKKRK